MKFTPETLMQIYLDGSFTDEAQAEFDQLMRQDPLFAEQVTKAVAARLGEVPDATVDAISHKLDGKIGYVWKQYKPSPALRVFKLGAALTLGLVAAGGLVLGGHWALSHWTRTSTLGGPAALVPPSPASQPAALKPSEPKSKKIAGMSKPKTTAQARPVVSAPPSKPVQPAVSAKPATAAPAQVSAKSQPASALKPAAVPAQRSMTSEGNSLRVAIDTEKTQTVEVTVFDGNGRLIRHLFNGSLDAGEHYVDWDGKDETGNLVLPGDYTVVLNQGGKKMSGILKVLPSQ